MYKVLLKWKANELDQKLQEQAATTPKAQRTVMMKMSGSHLKQDIDFSSTISQDKEIRKVNNYKTIQ